MNRNKNHDILKTFGLPLMIGGAGVFAITGKNNARNIGAVGTIMSLSWVIVEAMEWLNNNSKGHESM